MFKNYTLSLLLLCFAFYFGYGQYIIDFEDGSKDAYASETVTLNGIDWDMTEALIGTSAADWKNDSKSARLRGRNGSKLEMVQNKTNGIGAISFEYRRYGTDETQQPWIVQYSSNNGSTWTQIGAAFTPDGTVRIFSETVGQAGDVRIRIIINSTPGTSGNRRMNVDDIVITDYSGTPNPELQLTDSSSTNQNCGYTIDFGNQALSTDTDLTFNISNVGLADLTISSFDIAGDFSIVSPATPFVLTGGSSQIVTVRFTPVTDGTSSSTLTINNNDLDEGSCAVNLTGIGFTPGPNINVRGVIGSNPTIANGSTTVSSLNNTLFAQRVINTTQQTKTFRIGNEGGTAPLTVSSITLTGDTADFFVVSSFTNPLAINTTQDFTITFQPTTLSGVRSATVSIASSDSNKNPYTFVVQGTANCPSVSGSISPTEGPAGTIVTILSPGNNLTGATAELNGVPLNTISSTNLELIVLLPDTIATGGPLSVQLTNGCIFSNAFNLINEIISGCEASSSATVGDLFISEVTDSPTGSLTYVELYNATGAAINFAITNYSIQLYNNGNTTAPKTLLLNSGIVANNGTYVISMGAPSGPSDSQCPLLGGDGSLAQADLSLPGASINFFRNSSGIDNPNIGHDFIGLYDTSVTLIDAWGVFGDQTWATGLGLGLKGANFQRNTSVTIPNTTYSNADWVIIDWDDDSCVDVDYSTIGTYDFSSGTPPTVNSITNTSTACNEVTITVAATEGFVDGNELRYVWYAFNPTQAILGWQLITTGGIYTTVDTSPDLIISDATSVLDHQFYCEVRENDASCYTASNATKITIGTATWNGTTWLWNDGTIAGTLPSSSTNVVLNGNFNTSGPGLQDSFEACNLIVNPTYELVITNGNYIQVENDIIANGDITVFPQGSVVQIDDFATVTGSGIITVQKETTVLNNAYEYTYWSSPVANETIESALSTTPASRRFYFDALNFEDLLAEVGNTGVYNPGQDDIDDNGDAWQLASGPMLPGVGYAAMPSPFGPFPAPQQITFVGHFNNGIIEPTIYNNSGGDYNDWNFIGNPYPSAINTDIFFTVNSGVADAIYLWNQATPADFNASGNENANFSNADYALISGSGINTAGGNLFLIPKNIVPSGQGFFIAAVSGTNVTFNNSMRVTGDNDQFFRNSNPETENANSKNAVWLNLTSDNGVTKQIAIAHLEGATDYYDGSFYDVKENLSSGNAATIYSTIEDGSNSKFVIQCKHVSSLHENEVIPIGFETKITVATLYKISIAQFEGDFLSNNPIYLKDKDHNTIHNLKESDYTFTSQPGEFNNRFEIVFTPEALSIKDKQLTSNDLTIRELPNGDVELTVNREINITKVEILDLLGRQIYQLTGSSSREVYNLSKLSKAPYIAKVTLSTGQTITKKAIKQH